MRESNHESATAYPTSHAMVRPGEYMDVGTLLVPTDADPAPCLPPIGTEDGSAHMMKPPQGDDRAMLWRADHQSWSAHGNKGRRMAFPAAYLAAHGWRYVGALVER